MHVQFGKRMKHSKTPLELAFESVVLAAGGHVTSELHPYQQLKAQGCSPLDDTSPSLN